MSSPTTAAPPRHAPLAMDAAEFRTLGHRLVNQVADLLETVPKSPVTRDRPPAVVREALGSSASPPEHGEAPGPLLERTVQLLADHSLFNGHPRFFGYITSSPAPIGMLGDLLAAAVNPNVGAWALAPVATEIELQTIRWLASFIRYDSTASGILVSGGNMANMVGFFAARAAGAAWDIRAKGVAGGLGQPLVAYASAETHTWIQKAADIAGLGTDAVRWIETDDDLRMNVAALSRAIDADQAAGRVPFIVVGTAGSVSTGAVDPLPEIAALCRHKGIWFHVDGAYGGFAAAAPEAPADLRGLALADSVAVDPHKWLYSPLEAGCALVRDGEALGRAFAYHPPYYHFEQRAINFVDWGLQNSRGFRALKVWLALRHVGAAGYRRMIADDMRLARAMADAVARHPELQLVTQALSITTFRFVPADLESRAGDATVDRYLNDLNQALLDRLQRGGDLFVSNAVVRGTYALRACIVNFHTDLGDVEAVPEIVVREGRAIDGRERPAALAGHVERT